MRYRQRPVPRSQCVGQPDGYRQTWSFDTIFGRSSGGYLFCPDFPGTGAAGWTATSSSSIVADVGSVGSGWLPSCSSAGLGQRNLIAICAVAWSRSFAAASVKNMWARGAHQPGGGGALRVVSRLFHAGVGYFSARRSARSWAGRLRRRGGRDADRQGYRKCADDRQLRRSADPGRYLRASCRSGARLSGAVREAVLTPETTGHSQVVRPSFDLSALRAGIHSALDQKRGSRSVPAINAPTSSTHVGAPQHARQVDRSHSTS